ncbi:nucleotide exchange factor GrpE [Proteiniphilum sp. UBA1028]|jgi:molecular chaperone GrpE|uniref:nucleotide exchange factor GrpE n=1 Tax=Proteiniphilum sp. UBA1028 TaxID=1947251 RepID=UPI0025EE71B8|nr:nucleotide exchange factor GrpE [Proteiniphilum sp. UBA1028]
MMQKDNQHTNPRKRDEELNKEVTRDEEATVSKENEDKLTDAAVADQKQQDELQQKYDDLNNSYLRLHAEFDNFRKRTLKEKADLIKSGGERVLLDIISLVDDFERALVILHEAEDKDAMLEGMDLIYGKFINFLKQHGVKEIETIGLPFDADRFEAVTTIPAQDESQKGVVVDCIMKGYALNEKIIRFPKVIVGE